MPADVAHPARLARAFSSSPYRCHGLPQRWEWVLGRGLVDTVHTIERPGMHLLFCEGLEVTEPLKSFLGAYDVVLSTAPIRMACSSAAFGALGARLVLSQPRFRHRHRRRSTRPILRFGSWPG